MGFSSPFGEISSGDRNAGLPHQHLPFSEFLTLSTGSSRLGPAALFHAASTCRISGLQSFSRATSLGAFQRLVLSCR
jgi:hypothetical protein